MLKRLLLVVVLLAVAAGAALWWVGARLDRPYRGFAGDEVFVDLPQGIGVAGIARRLADAGVVADPWTFRLAVHLTHDDRRLQAGEYRFAAAATPYEIAWRLAHGDVFKITVTFPEGLTLSEMADVFARSGLGTADDFRAAASNGALVAAIDPAAPSLEGYLFPNTYALSRHAGADGTVRAMVRAFEHAFSPALRDAAVGQGLALRDVVILASIVEKETAQPDERPLVAAVYRNRLELGMPLQCDPTVIYAMQLAGTWHGNLTHADLEMRSPYNTYVVKGLPPGPIAAPGLASLRAAIYPADVKYLYFVSRNDGTHAFATTLAEHNRNVARYQLHR